MTKAVLARIGDLCEQIRGVSYDGAEASDSPAADRLPVLRANNITDNGLVFDDLVFVPRSRIREKQMLRRGDIVIAASSGSLDVVGKAAMCDRSFAGSFGAFCKALRPRDIADPLYLSYFFRSPTYRHTISHLAAGANINNLRNEHLDDLRIPLPPLPEQKRIAAILDKADAIRLKRRESLRLLDDLLRSVFLDMFGRKQWPKKSVDYCLQPEGPGIRTGPFGSQLHHDEFVPEGIPVLGIDNVVTNEFRWTEPRCLCPEKYERFRRYRVFPDDILITIMGTVGRACVAPKDLPECMSTKHLCVLTLNQNLVRPRYLWGALLFDQEVRRQRVSAGRGAIMEGWNTSVIRRLTISLPPLPQQINYEKAFEQVNALASLLSRSPLSADTLFHSLLQRAFRGEL